MQDTCKNREIYGVEYTESEPFDALLAVLYDICDTLDALNYQATAREYRQQADYIIKERYGVH